MAKFTQEEKWLIGLVECRKCHKTFIHHHKCTPNKEEIADLKDMVLGVSSLVRARDKEIAELKAALAATRANKKETT